MSELQKACGASDAPGQAAPKGKAKGKPKPKAKAKVKAKAKAKVKGKAKAKGKPKRSKGGGKARKAKTAAVEDATEEQGEEELLEEDALADDDEEVVIMKRPSARVTRERKPALPQPDPEKLSLPHPKTSPAQPAEEGAAALKGGDLFEIPPLPAKRMRKAETHVEDSQVSGWFLGLVYTITCMCNFSWLQLTAWCACEYVHNCFLREVLWYTATGHISGGGSASKCRGSCCRDWFTSIYPPVPWCVYILSFVIYYVHLTVWAFKMV